MNNVAAPTVASPMLNVQGLISPQVMEIPKVSCVAEAKQYPSKPGTEDVLFDQNDPDIAYFRHIDTNGFVQIDRRRCVPESEPTQEELNDKRYLSREEFSNFMTQFTQFREEMSENVRILAASATTNNAANSNKPNGNKPYNKQHSGNQNPNAGSSSVQ